MKYVSVQPANNYFVWQCEVFKYQFEKLGYNLNDSITVFVHNGELPVNVKKYVEKYPNTIIVPDQRRETFYIPSIKIHGLYHLYKDHFNIIDGHNVFLHDSDIVFTQYFDWDSIVKKERTVYASDCISYIGAQYIDSKSPELTDKMCAIVGIDPKVVRDNRGNSGSAQTIFPKEGIDYNYFFKCENDANALYRYCSSEEGKSYKKEGDPYPLQAWTAEMWSVLWNLWLIGIETVVHPDMNFSWPNWTLDQLSRVKIFHLAGITSDENGQFFKAKYIKSMPFGTDLSKINKDKAYGYYSSIVEELAFLKDYYMN